MSAIKIGTHDGTFHCDEALACFMLRLLPRYKDATIVRTRNPALLAQCDLVVDVGATYDPSKHRYDHHQRGFTETLSPKHVTKLSSAGLIYKHFGKEAIQQLSENSLSAKDNEVIFQRIYKNFIEALDGIDNGINQYPDDIAPAYTVTTDLSSRVGRLNTRWNQDEKNIDERFQKAMNMAGFEFVDAVDALVNSWLPARDVVQVSYDARKEVHPSGSIMKLTQFSPWKEHLSELEGDDPQILYVLFQDTTGSWRVQCVNEPNSFQSRLPLPEAWRGVRDDELSKLTGIEGCIFVHASGFIGGAKTYDAVLRMASQALDLGSSAPDAKRQKV